jgi:hypothetical protein
MGCARETGISWASVNRVLKTAKWKGYVFRLLHAVVEDDPDRRSEICEWFQRKVYEDALFVDMTVWSDVVTFKLNGTVNRHNCTYWSSENPNTHVDKAVNLLFGVVCHPGVLWDRATLKGQLLVLSPTCLRYPLCPPFISCMEMGKFTTNKTGHRT